MRQTIVGLFKIRENAENAVSSLKTGGIDTKDISIVMKNPRDNEGAQNDENRDIASDKAAGDMGQDVKAGVTTGAILGGLAGLLASFLIPGLGAFFIGGPIAAALGLGGAAALTASGVVTGAAAGGILGVLTSVLGLSEDDAREYEAGVNQGSILVGVPVEEQDIVFVTGVFRDNDATNVRTVSRDGEQETERPGRSFSKEDQLGSSRRYAAMGAKGGKSSGRSRSSSSRSRSSKGSKGGGSGSRMKNT
jgi:hypothetical protein